MKNQQALTAGLVNRLKPPESGYEIYWDSDSRLKGFCLRVTAAGKKTYYVQRRIRGEGKEVRYKLGEHGELDEKGEGRSPEQFAKDAAVIIDGMKKGIDPRQKKVKEEIEKYSLRDALNDRLKSNTKLKDRTKEQYNQIFNTIFEEWLNRPIASITIGDIQSKFRDMKEKTPTYAKQAFSMLHAVFEYASGEYEGNIRKLHQNTVKLAIRKNDWPVIKERTGRIPNEKVSLVWRALTELKDGEETANQPIKTHVHIDMVMFLMLTGCRLNEAANLTWDRVNLEEQWWHLPDPKNRNPVWLPLSKQAIEILKSRPRINNYVFASYGSTGHAIEPRGIMEFVSKIAGRKLSPHDLRRTFITVGINVLKVDFMTVELLTNHKPQGVTARNYLETSELQHLLPEVQLISDFITGV